MRKSIKKTAKRTIAEIKEIDMALILIRNSLDDDFGFRESSTHDSGFNTRMNSLLANPEGEESAHSVNTLLDEPELKKSLMTRPKSLVFTEPADCSFIPNVISSPDEVERILGEEKEEDTSPGHEEANDKKDKIPEFEMYVTLDDGEVLNLSGS
jgi:hypothetical protein